jgi:glycosyltransferase involved in cell wall biosynthesis
LLSKSSPADLDKFKRILRESHFMVMPTIAEAFGVVFCEAAAYAVPSLAPQIGGIPTIIKNGFTGMTFPVGSDPLDYAKYLLNVFKSKQIYRSMAIESWHAYRNTFNWDAGAAKFHQMCEEIL